MKTFTAADVRLEDWVRGPFFVADSATARASADSAGTGGSPAAVEKVNLGPQSGHAFGCA